MMSSISPDKPYDFSNEKRSFRLLAAVGAERVAETLANSPADVLDDPTSLRIVIGQALLKVSDELIEELIAESKK